MGMTEIFSNSANLLGLLDSGEQLKVSDVVHKAIIAIDENGSEVSAGTGIIFSNIIIMKWNDDFSGNN